MKYWSEWLKAAGIRAIKTVAQTAIATIGTSAAIHEVNWLLVGSASLLAGLLSMLTSLAGIPECKDCEKENVSEEVKEDSIEEEKPSEE